MATLRYKVGDHIHLIQPFEWFGTPYIYYPSEMYEESTRSSRLVITELLEEGGLRNYPPNCYKASHPDSTLFGLECEWVIIESMIKEEGLDTPIPV